MSDKRKTVSLIFSVFNEAENLPVLYERLKEQCGSVDYDVEFIFVDDGSTDDTFAILESFSKADPRMKLLSLSRNFGSHSALMAGMAHCRGDCAIALSADLQEPPQLLDAFLNEWEAGAEVVYGIRSKRNDPFLSVLLSDIFSAILRQLVFKNFPKRGFDIFLIGRKVIDVLTQAKEKNTSLMGLIFWSGFKQKGVEYVREKRAHGKSKWNLGKKVKIAIDTFASFSYLPVRFASCLGLAISMVGFLYAIFIVLRKWIYTVPVPGWTSLMVVVLLLSGVQLTILGILGEYLWRALDEAKRRPLFIVRKKVGL